MTLVEKINLKYDQAIRDVDKLITGGPLTAQARYDRQKSLKEGRNQSRYNTSLERMKHELQQERKMTLRGVQEVLDYIQEECDIETYESLKEVIGDPEII